MAKASKKAEDKMRREREKLEKQEKQDAKKRRRANKTEEETKKKEPEPSGASNKRKAKDMGPVEPSAPEEADVVAAAFQRLQAVGIDHFDVDLKAGRKSFTVKPPMGSGASSIGCILTGSGSFYVYKLALPEVLAKLPASCEVKAGSLYICTCECARVCNGYIFVFMCEYASYAFVSAGEQERRVHYPMGETIRWRCEGWIGPGRGMGKGYENSWLAMMWSHNEQYVSSLVMCMGCFG